MTTNTTFTHVIEQVNENGDLRYSALVRKSIKGGIDGPFTETIEYPGLVEAMQGLRDFGFTTEGTYKITPRYGSFEKGFFAEAKIEVAA